MKPLNEIARKKARNRFLGMYGISLLAVLLVSYFLFSSPVRILKEDAQSYNAFKVQHDGLMHKLSSISEMTTQLVRSGPDRKDQQATTNASGEEYKAAIKRLLDDLKTYGDKETTPQVKEDLKHYIAAYNAVLYSQQVQDNRMPEENTIAATVTPTENVNTNESALINKLNTDIKNLNAERKKLTDENKRLLTLLNEDNTENINRSWQAKLVEIEKEKDLYKNQSNVKTEELRSKDVIIRDLRKEKENIILECEKRTISTPPVSEEKTRLFQAVDKVIKKNKHTKKEVLVDFNNILRSVESTYPQRALLDKKVGEINKLMIGDF